MIIITITELLSTESLLSLGVPVGGSFLCTDVLSGSTDSLSGVFAV